MAVFKIGNRHYLTCEEFKQYDKDCICCLNNCHHPSIPNRSDMEASSKLLFFAPPTVDGLNKDYELMIEGVVCCTMYHVLQSMTRQQWETLARVITQGGHPDRLTSAPKCAIIGVPSKKSTKSRVGRMKSSICVVCGAPSDSDLCDMCGG